jgi:hypothetical protein
MAYEVAARHLSCERHSTTLRQIGRSGAVFYRARFSAMDQSTVRGLLSHRDGNDWEGTAHKEAAG